MIVFTDTPGIIGKVEDLMSKNINLEAPKSTARKDVVVCLVDISREKSEEENKVIGNTELKIIAPQIEKLRNSMI